MAYTTCWIGWVLVTATLAAACGDESNAQHGGAGSAGAAGAQGGAMANGGVGGALSGRTSGGASATAGSGSARAGSSGAQASAGSDSGRAGTSGTSTGASGTTASAGSDNGAAGADGAAAGATSTGSGTPTLFWLDVSGKVLSSDATKFAVRTVVPSAGQGSDGIAVDVAAGYIYWTDMGVPADDDGSVMRSKLDGSSVTTIVPKGGTYTPKQLKLVPEERKLYWSDREGMRVMRSNVDGTEIETLYQSGSTDADRSDDSRWCVGIAVDVAGGYFYWSQKGTDTGHEGSVRRAHLAMPSGDTPATRSDVEVLFDGEAATCDIDLDLDAGFIYWANRGDDTINRGPLTLPSGATAKTRNDKQTVVKKVDQAIGVFLDGPRGLVYYTDAVGDVGRANFDGSGAEFLLTGAGAFTGIVVVDLPK